MPDEEATSNTPVIDTSPAFCVIASAAFVVSVVDGPVPPVQGCPVEAYIALAWAHENSSAHTAAPEETLHAARALATVSNLCLTTVVLVSRTDVANAPVTGLTRLVSVTNA